MIQELFGGLVQESKIPLINPSSSSSTSISSPSQSASASSPTSSSSSDAQAQAQAQQNLRCPRCDSSNTKFCYYNNYNLTQPRHFCKTCRRYWTKGGALRNVPIGGGCRKAKAAVPAILPARPGVGCGGSGKAKPMTPIDVMGRVAALGVGLDHHNHNHSPDLLPPSPILWASMPHSSHLLTLFRASQMQNPNPNPNPNPTHSLLNSIRIKEEGAMLGGAAVVTTEPNCALNAHGLSLDHHLNGSCSSSMWRSENQFHNQYQQQQQQQLQLPQQNLLLLSDVPTSTGIQELYHRLRSSSTLSNSNNCSNDHLQSLANNVGSANTCSSSAAVAATMATTTTTASVMDPIPLSGGDFGYWNPSWSADLSTATNGTFP